MPTRCVTRGGMRARGYLRLLIVEIFNWRTDDAPQSRYSCVKGKICHETLESKVTCRELSASSFIQCLSTERPNRSAVWNKRWREN